MTDPGAISSQSASVPDALAGQRLDQALAQMFPEYSRSRLKSLDIAGLRLGRWCPTASPGDIVSRWRDGRDYAPARESPRRAKPQAIPLDAAFEDDEVLVVDKPAGLVVHPGAGNAGGTLMNGLLYRLPQLKALPRAGIVHRLDKDTSGLLLIGKTLESTHRSGPGRCPTGRSRDTILRSAMAFLPGAER